MNARVRALLVGVGSLLDLDGRATRQRMAKLNTEHHPFGDLCPHGVQFLNECDECPDGWQPQGQWKE